MSIDRAAQQGAFGAAEQARSTKEGRKEQRANLLAMAAWYRGKGDTERAAECKEQAEALK